MNLRLNTLLNLISGNYINFYRLIVFALFFLFSNLTYSQTEAEIKKQAEQLFEEEDYNAAYKHYSQLVSNNPRDPLYNYRLGVCMIYSEPDKKKSFSYLNQAYINRQNLPKDVTFFIGKAYHMNYLFDEAIRYYNEFKKEAPSSLQKKLQVEREIRACGNGKRLLSALTDLEVITKKQLNEADYFRIYDLASIGGKLLVKPDEFKTSTDKKRKDRSVIYMPKDGDKVFYSSYGDGAKGGKDIFYKVRMANGEFSKPVAIDAINTEYDEDYPFLHPNGKTLYFASKGHNSMGGYDIFKTTYNEETDSWTTPKNLEFPINSPDDDYLYVTDSFEKFAYFSTGRYSPPGKIDVLKIKTERRPIDFIFIKGTVAKETMKQSAASKITIKNISTGIDVGTFQAEDNGNFLLKVPNGAKLLYTVETPDLPTQSQGVSLPLATVGKPFKQTITYENKILKIINNFEEAAGDDNYLQYLKLIEEKAKLNPNEGKNQLSAEIVAQTKANETDNDTKENLAVNTNNPVVNNSGDTKNQTNQKPETTTKPTKDGMNNAQLVTMAKMDAQESAKEATQLLQDSKDAFELGEMNKIKAASQLKDAQKALNDAQLIDDNEMKQEAIESATKIVKEAEIDLKVADEVLKYAKALENDAKRKEKEAKLNQEYAAVLEKISTPKGNTPENNSKLNNTQQQLAALNDYQSESEALYNSVKNNLSEKEDELAIASSNTNKLIKEINEIKSDIRESENELSKTKKKKDKAEIQNVIDEMNNSLKSKEANLAAAQKIEETAATDVALLKNQVQVKDRIKNEDIAKPVEAIATNTSKDEKISSKELEEKYYGKTTAVDRNNVDNLSGANETLIKYNQEVDEQINRNKAALAQEKNPNIKKTISAEIKNLETIKKQNQQSIANNNNRISELKKQEQLAQNTLPPNTGLKPVNENETPANAMEQLKEIKNALTQADNQYFNYNEYKNPESQNKKIEADQQINEVYALQNKLKETITKAEENIKNNSVSLTKNSNNPDELLKQSDELAAKAQEKRNESKNKQGAEKTKLINEAIDLEKESEKKQIEASEVAGKIASDKFDVNKQNIKGLISSNKASSSDIDKANELLSDSEIALKQANALREEANAMTNNAAKIGNLGNAEEKEQIALSKQKEAQDLLMKSNPDFALSPYKNYNTINITNENVVKEEIAKVNQELKNVITAKTQAYESLAKANDDEIYKLNSELEQSNSSSPTVKAQISDAQKKMTEADVIKLKLNSAVSEYDKLILSGDYVKKQTEAITAFNKAKESVDKQEALASKNNNQGTSNINQNNQQNTGNDSQAITTTKGVEGDNTANNQQNKNNDSQANNPVKGTEGNNAQNNQQNNTSAATQKTSTSTVGAEKANTAFSVDLSFENHKDTTINAINTYLSQNDITLRNLQANSMKNSSMEALNSLEKDNNRLHDEILADAQNNNAGGTISGSDIKNKAESLSDAADNLTETATNLRNEAEDKSGEEKAALLNQAKEIDKKALNKRIEASMLTYQYNEANYNANRISILEMLAIIKDTKPDIYSTLKENNEEIESGKKQARTLREEANAIKNNAAKIGAISNAEEEEAELLVQQNKLIASLQNYASGYTVKGPVFSNINDAGPLNPELAQKQKDLQQKIYNELTAVTNAYNLEYETGKNLIPKNLNADQTKIKNNIASLNTQAKNLLVKSSQISDMNEKIKLVSLAAKTSHAAATQLNVLINKEEALAGAKTNNNVLNTSSNSEKGTEVVNTTKSTETKNNNTATETKTNVVAANTKETKEPTETKTNNQTSSPSETTTQKVLARVEGLEVLNMSAYSDAKPIPVNAKIPDGLLFRVQIGAFRNPIPNNSFRGLTPVNAETAANGFIRYTAGNFNQIENASAVKNDLNRNGYPDAFVVAFFNGKRISINEALEIMSNEGKTVNLNAPSTAGIKENVTPINITPAVVPTEIPVTVTKELEKTENLLYTVQIGVYSKAVSKERLNNLSPIYTERLASGLYRYTAGIYNNTERLVNDKNKVVSLGIKDAFVTAYLNGKRVSFNEAKDRQNSDMNIKLESENPIIFPALPAGEIIPAVVPPIAIPAPTVAPFTNKVSSYPAPTEDNGVKTNEDGVTFKVQVGAYSKQVPADVATKYNSIKNWPIENKILNGLYIYTIGSFSEARFAKQLKDEAVELGITDAFITVYKDGRKLFGQEATNYLNR